MLKAAGQNVPASKPALEINPRHPIVQRLGDEPDETRFADWSHILFDQATLAEGGQLEDPAAFVRRLNDVMLTLAGRTASRIWTP
jgi:molecular chaperone HtpG